MTILSGVLLVLAAVVWGLLFWMTYTLGDGSGFARNIARAICQVTTGALWILIAPVLITACVRGQFASPGAVLILLLYAVSFGGALLAITLLATKDAPKLLVLAICGPSLLLALVGGLSVFAPGRNSNTFQQAMLIAVALLAASPVPFWVLKERRNAAIVRKLDAERIQDPWK